MSTQITSKLRDYTTGYGHYCPGCKRLHIFTTSSAHANHNWFFDGDVERPTFNPSMLIHGLDEPAMRAKGYVRCHYFLHDGVIKFLGDCDHEMANQTVELPDLPAWARDE